MGENSKEIYIGYVIVQVNNLYESVAFFKDKLGLPLEFLDDSDFNIAFFETASASLGLIQSQDDVTGKATGIGFITEDLDAAYADWCAQGVRFIEAPALQPWGDYMGIFADPDGNTYYLTQIGSDEPDEEGKKINVDVSVNLTAGGFGTD